MINMPNLKSLNVMSVRRRFIAAMFLTTFLPLAVFLHFIGRTYISGAALICLAVLVACGWWLMFDLVRSIERAYTRSRQYLTDLGGLAERIISSDCSEVTQLQEAMHILSCKVKESLEAIQLMSIRVEELEITDADTGFYNVRFFTLRLEEEIKRSRAYQRPCGLLVVYLDNYWDYRETLGEERLGGVLEGLSALIREAVRSHDIIGRLSENSVAVIALEMNRRQTSYTSSKLQDKIAQFLKRESDIVPQLTIKIAESPIDGISADALLAAAGVKIG